MCDVQLSPNRRSKYSKGMQWYWFSPCATFGRFVMRPACKKVKPVEDPRHVILTPIRSLNGGWTLVNLIDTVFKSQQDIGSEYIKLPPWLQKHNGTPIRKQRKIYWKKLEMYPQNRSSQGEIAWGAIGEPIRGPTAWWCGCIASSSSPAPAVAAAVLPNTRSSRTILLSSAIQSRYVILQCHCNNKDKVHRNERDNTR
jgi:hypothetical protein